jgi:predicted transcriptional regulator
MQGELESAVLDVLWNSPGALTSNQVLDALGKEPALALTTVLTVLGRLQDKGLVTREVSGRVGLFKATETRDEHVAKLLLSVLSSSQNPTLAIAHFAKGLSDDALTALKKTLE